MNKTILFDIDETLVYDNKYPMNFSSIKEKIKLLSNRYDLGICTNRPYDENVKEIMKEYGINGIVISEVGACIYKNRKIIYSHARELLNNRILKILADYEDVVELNPNRINSASLHIKGNKKYTDIIINEIRKENDLKVYKLNDYKIGITYKGVNKINAIKNYFQDNDVIFVTDYEEDISKHKNNIQLYSVGKNDIFNSKCDKTYDNIESVLNDIGGIK